MTAAEREAEPDTGDLSLYQVKVYAIKRQHNTTPDIAPEYRVYAFSEDHAVFRATQMATCGGLEERGVELLDSNVADYGDNDYE